MEDFKYLKIKTKINYNSNLLTKKLFFFKKSNQNFYLFKDIKIKL
jgi:hypothetical protein